MNYDVIIIGAGPGGSSSATFLAHKGLNVLLLDKASFPRHKTCGDGLTPRCVAIIEKLGILEEVSAVSQRIEIAKIIAPNGKQLSSQMKDTCQSDAYMLAIPRYELDNILFKNAVASGIDFKENCKVISIENKPYHIIVKGEIDGTTHEFKAKYSIIAVGASMGLLKKQNFIDERPSPIIAARAYFENANHDSDCFNFHFNDVTLPGYGWIFPLAKNRINVGVGVIPSKKIKPQHIKSLFSDFIQQEHMKDVLAGAKQISEIQSYPIRTDFSTSTIYKERTLLVGEAAGLVNPLTGEGIDYALESGEIVAEHLSEIIKGNDNPDDLNMYEQALRKKYMPIFNFSNQLISCCLKPFMLNTMVKAAAHKKSLNQSLTNIILGLKEPPEKITAGLMIAKIYKHIVKS